MIKKLVIANRGEIAIRIIRACREIGIRPVAVFSEADRTSLHVLYADEAYCIGPPPALESYLSIQRIIEVAQQCQADAIHPGYGFLAENAAFARACEENRLIFVGPSSRAIEMMGDKTFARRLMKEAGVPVVQGTERPLESDEEALRLAEEIGYPIIVKAAMGGGGKGMRIVRSREEIASSLRASRSEAGASFGDSSVYIEKYLERPRHIEMQILADSYGHTISLGERECSIQRRHQKLIEESPSPYVDPRLRETMGRAAVKAAEAVNYVNAGTVEFLVDQSGQFYFLEMNTRLQVEHPVTEMVTGIDMVKAQLLIASGEKLELAQDDIRLQGSSIECRIYAEDPDHDFIPSPGTITYLQPPGGPGVRDERGVYQGYEVPTFYDSLISKLVVWGKDRLEAIARMKRALSEYKISGIKTTIPFHQTIMEDEAFVAGDLDTHFIEQRYKGSMIRSGESLKEIALIAAAIDTQERGKQKGAPVDEGGPRYSPWKIAGRGQGFRNRF